MRRAAYSSTRMLTARMRHGCQYTYPPATAGVAVQHLVQPGDEHQASDAQQQGQQFEHAPQCGERRPGRQGVAYGL